MALHATPVTATACIAKPRITIATRGTKICAAPAASAASRSIDASSFSKRSGSASSGASYGAGSRPVVCAAIVAIVVMGASSAGEPEQVDQERELDEQHAEHAHEQPMEQAAPLEVGHRALEHEGRAASDPDHDHGVDHG